MREGDDPRLTLEVALLKVTSPSLDSSREALLRRIESLESQLTEGAPGAAPSAGRAGDESATKAQAVDKPAIEQPEPAESAPPATPSVPDVQEQNEPEASVATARAGVEIGRVVELWPAVVDHLRESGSAMLSTLFEGARPLGIDEERSVLRIGFPTSAKFNKRKAEAATNIERMTDAIAAVVGARLRPAYELIEEGGPAPPSEQTVDAVGEEELIEMIKDNFNASEVAPDDARKSEAG
jgi:hypothetical protein